MSAVPLYKAFIDKRNFGDFVQQVMEDLAQKKVSIKEAPFEFARTLDNVGSLIFRRRIANEVDGGSLLDAVMELAEKFKV